MPQPALVFHTYDIVASPTDDAEVVIAILSDIDTSLPGLPINLHAWAKIEVDADATSAVLTVRRGSLTGDVVGSGPAHQDFVAGDAENVLVGIDALDLPGDVASATYVVTLSMSDASAGSTVGGVHLSAQV